MLVITTEALPSQTHPDPITFFGDVSLLGTELEVTVRCLRAKSKAHLQRLFDSVHRGLEGVQHDNVVKPLVVEKVESTGRKREVRVATPLAPASLEELLEQVEEAEKSENAAATTTKDSVLADLGIEWNAETKKDVVAQMLNGLAHLHKTFAAKADYECRFFANLKPSNILLYSRGSQGGFTVKLTDYFCLVIRRKEDLEAVLDEKFGRVPGREEWKEVLDVNQWKIMEAEMYLAGDIVKRILGSTPPHPSLNRLMLSMLHPEASCRLSSTSTANHPLFWSCDKKASFLAKFLVNLDFRKKGLKEAIRSVRDFVNDDAEAPSWSEEKLGIDRRLLEELRKKRKGGYEDESFLGLVEFMQDVGKQLARPTRVLAPLMDELFPTCSSTSSSSVPSHVTYFLDRFPNLPEACLSVCADLPAMKEFVSKEIQRVDIPKKELVVVEEEEEEEEEVEEDIEVLPDGAAEVNTLVETQRTFTDFRQASRPSNSDEDVEDDDSDQGRDSVSPVKDFDEVQDYIDKSGDSLPTTIADAEKSVEAVSSASPATQIDVDIEALTSMWSRGAGNICEDAVPAFDSSASTTPAFSAPASAPAPRASAPSTVDDLSDLLSGFGVAEIKKENVLIEKTQHLETSSNIFSSKTKSASSKSPVASASSKSTVGSLDLGSLTEALEDAKKQESKASKTTLAKILTAKEMLEGEEVDEALEILEDVDMTYELLMQTKIGISLRAAKKKATDSTIQKNCSDLIAKWKSVLLDQVDKENVAKKNAKAAQKKNTYKFVAETATCDDLRLKSRKLLLDALVDRREEAPPMKIAKNIAARVEETIFQTCDADTGNKYRTQIRSRVFNLRDVKNPELGDDVINGAIMAEDFARMTSEEMASKDMKRLREDLRQEANRTERVLHSPRNLFLTRW